MHSSAYLPSRNGLYAYRVLYTDRSTYLISIRAPRRPAQAYTPRLQSQLFRFSHSGRYRTELHSTLGHTVLALGLLYRSQPFLSSTSETDSIHSLICPDLSNYTIEFPFLAVVSLPLYLL